MYINKMVEPINKENNQTSKVIEWLFVLFLSTKPIYLFSSGALQISDIILLLLMTSLMFLYGFSIETYPSVFRWMCVMTFGVFYILLINIIWSMIESSGIGMIKNTLYYIFNLFVVVAVIMMERYVGFFRLRTLLVKGMFISSILNLIGVISSWGDTARGVGLFNNPNQLGYYSLILISVCILFRDHTSNIQKIIMWTSGILGIVSSSSKASIISIIILYLIDAFFVRKEHSSKEIVKVLLKCLILFVAVYFLLYSENPVISNNQTVSMARTRILSMNDEADAELGTGRGYDRVSEIGLNVIWGVGEGEYERFSVLTNDEVHSIYVNVIVSYGIIGGGIWLWLLFKPLVGDRKWRFLLQFSGILLYGVTHNGIRNTLLWTILTVVLIQNSWEYENVEPESDFIIDENLQE